MRDNGQLLLSRGNRGRMIGCHLHTRSLCRSTLILRAFGSFEVTSWSPSVVALASAAPALAAFSFSISLVSAAAWSLRPAPCATPRLAPLRLAPHRALRLTLGLNAPCALPRLALYRALRFVTQKHLLDTLP